MFDRRFFVCLDGLLLGAVLVLCLIGLVMIYSTTYDPIMGSISQQLFRQVGAICLGLVALFACLIVDYRVIVSRAFSIYGGLVALLVYTLFFGVEAGGAQRWIDIGLFNLQPSEFARLVVVLVLCSLYTESYRSNLKKFNWIIGGMVVVVPFVLVAQEPDLGTAVTLLPICLMVMIFAGLRLRWVAIVAVIAILLTPVAWTYALEDYQRARISSFLDPDQDPHGAGYQQIQARITVGSGGLSGKGFLESTQSQYNFLPVAHNDFIFSVLAEEHGFLGVLFSLGLYLFIILRSLDAARVAQDQTGMLLVVGLTTGFACQVIYNVMMSAGLVPVKGLTLPLMSYGGSSIVATLMSFGLILNVRMRRFIN